MPKSNIPRRKRMKRAARLLSAKQWIATSNGRRIVSRYAKWYGVDLLCAIKELRLSGVEITSEYENQVKQMLAANARKNAERKQKKEAENAPVYGIDFDDNLACIVGYTPGGAPYGLSWEEAEGMP